MVLRPRLTRNTVTLAAALMLATASAACGGSEEKTDEAPAEAPAETPAAAPAEPAPPPGPAPEEGYDWTLTELHDTPGRIALSYNVPETDDVPLSFFCQEGSGRVEAGLDSEITGVGAIILRSGEAQGMYPVTTREHSDMSGGEWLTVAIPTSDATLQAFKTSGWINLTLAGAARDMAAHPGAAPAAITAFFDRCASATPSPEPSGGTAPAAASPG